MRAYCRAIGIEFIPDSLTWDEPVPPEWTFVAAWHDDLSHSTGIGDGRKDTAQSPGMHHTHHSYLDKHWAFNLGLVTSFRDPMFSTLYIAERYEATPWGLAPMDQCEYTTLSDNLMTPFREIIRILRGKPKVHPAEFTQPDALSGGTRDLRA